MKNVAIYCRVSTQMQTTDRQKEELIKLAIEKGYAVNEDYIYIDVISGFKKGENRPAFSQLLGEIERGTINLIFFSEFSRLARNATDLLKQIEFFQSKGIELYFQKQNLLVSSDKTNIGNTILLHVLAVMSSYEIELFAERSISGKISKIQNGGADADARTYGYMYSNKKIVINEEEANIVRKIFEMYVDGKSCLNILDWLTVNGIPTPIVRRYNEYNANRKSKNKEEKVYQIDIENKKWRLSTISRLLHNELYTGKRHITYYKPDPTNPVAIKKRKDREVLYEHNEQVESLRIISDELFELAQAKLLSAAYNKNNAIKHDNLIKDKLICGYCGNNFTVGNEIHSNSKDLNDKKTYKDYGAVNRKDKPRSCDNGSNIQQCKLDGLVVAYSLKMFTKLNLKEENEKKIDKLYKEVEELNVIVSAKQQEKDNLDNEYENTISKLLKIKTNAIIEKKMITETEQYDNNVAELMKQIDSINKDITNKRILISQLKQIKDFELSEKDQMDELRKNKKLIKEMIHQYIDKIVVFKVNSLWNLIQIKYNIGVELWGSVKLGRYKNTELFFDEVFCRHGIERKSWYIDNSDNAFEFDIETKTFKCNKISEFHHSIPVGEYSFKEFDNLLRSNEYMNSFPLYFYEDSQEDELEKNIEINDEQANIEAQDSIMIRNAMRKQSIKKVPKNGWK